MKSITEVLGSVQMLFDLDFDLQDAFEAYLTSEQKVFLSMLRVIETKSEWHTRKHLRIGRPSYDEQAFLRAFLALSFFRIRTVSDLRARLRSDVNLRQICGFQKVPSLASFSRRLAHVAGTSQLHDRLAGMIHEYRDEIVVTAIARDSTAIEARERPRNKKSDIVPAARSTHRRGRPRKDEGRQPKERSVLEAQQLLSPDAALAGLPQACAWGCKKNSQGNLAYWKGYKLHLDVTDTGIPVTAVVTAANVHDSQVAIPMERITETRLSWRYSLMDAAYDANAIRQYIEQRGRSAIIDRNRRRSGQLCPMEKAQSDLYRMRSAVERAYAHLKDWLIPTKLYVRGIEKVTFQILRGVLCLASLKLLQCCIVPYLKKQEA